MCLIYRPKRRPTFTRLCYRYRDMRGRHVPGEWACGEYPKPGRRPAGPGPGQTRPAALCERCRRPSPRIPYCEDCSIAVQIEALPEDMRRAWAEKLGIDLGPDINPGLNPEPPGPADREETEIQPRLFTDLPEPEHEQEETQKGLRS